MVLDDVRVNYDTAWQRLGELAEQRNALLRQLASMATLAGEFSPTKGLLIEFNVDRADSILKQIQEIRPRIFSTIEEVNRYAVQLGKPRIERQRLDV